MENIIIGTLIIISFLMLCVIIWLIGETKNRIHYDNKTKEKNLVLQQQHGQLYQEHLELSKLIADEQNQLKNIQEQKLLEEEKHQSQLTNALSTYADTLSEKYQQVEDWFDKRLEQISIEYKNEEAELEAIKNTRAAMIEANRREELVKANPELFTLPLNPADRTDIQTLEKIKGQLNNPRILSMLIWSTFFQKPMTTLCNNILGTKIICGIYKITNLNTNMCYIGQAVDIATRWKTHCKCGLGIDTPQSNKLYKAMQEDGVWNFSWELLEECPQSQLNEKEAEYIEIYQSKDYGYNTQAGRKI